MRKKDEHNAEQLEIFADLLEPASEIIGDGEIAAVLKPGGGKLLNAFKLALKNHKNAVIRILARIDGIAESDYVVPDFVALWKKLVAFVNLPGVQELFMWQGQTSDGASSGSATESTEDAEN